MSQRQPSIQISIPPDAILLRQENIFYPGRKPPVKKKIFTPRTLIIYLFTGLCFLVFASSAAGLVLKTTGLFPDKAPAPTPIPAQSYSDSPKLALILPENEISKCFPKRIDQEQGTVTAVLSADTIEVQFADGAVQEVHYIGMAPDPDAYKNEQAKSVNQQLVDRQTVVLVRDVTDKDLFGRLQRYVFVGDTFVNYELVARGWAVLETLSPDTACADGFRHAQQQAAAAGLGIWAASAAGQ